jgi:protein-disulfide isomerase
MSVRVLIYEDLQCPDSARFSKMLDQKLLPKYAEKVAFEHRDFPLAKHDWARRAAMAARFMDATNPALGSDFRRYVMGHQSQITSANFNTFLERYAADHGIEPKQAVAALGDAELSKAVQKDVDEGVAHGVAHTPTLLVNGQPFVETFTYEEIAKAIDSQLAAHK